MDGGESSGERGALPPKDRRRGVEAFEAELRERRIEMDAEREDVFSL